MEVVIIESFKHLARGPVLGMKECLLGSVNTSPIGGRVLSL
jgi:hypothetical protein